MRNTPMTQHRRSGEGRNPERQPCVYLVASSQWRQQRMKEWVGMRNTPMTQHRRSGEGRNPERQPCVYLLAGKRKGTLYLGITSNLIQRVWQHKSDLAEGFTRRYGVHTLVRYEGHDTI